MSAVAGAVVPVFGTVALGYALARCGVFSQAVGAGLVRFMYFLAIPAMLFRALVDAQLPSSIPWSYLAAFYLPSLAVFGIAMLAAVGGFRWRRQDAGIAGMTSAYSNMFLLGMPLTVNAFGETAAVPMFILLATQSTLLFPLTTYALEAGASPLLSREAVKRLGLNPILISLVLGIIANATGFELAPTVDKVFTNLGDAAPGCALIALGITLAGQALGGAYRHVLVVVALKNALHPMLVWLACIVFAVPQTWTAVAVILAAMPCGVNALIFARQYDIGVEVVSKSIVVSTLVSSLVITILLAQFV